MKIVPGQIFSGICLFRLKSSVLIKTDLVFYIDFEIKKGTVTEIIAV